MKKNWNENEFLTDFVLIPNELHLFMVNKTEANRLGFALLLKYFQQEAKFPSTKQDVPKVSIEYIAKQLDISPEHFEEYYWGWKRKDLHPTSKKHKGFLWFSRTHTYRHVTFVYIKTITNLLYFVILQKRVIYPKHKSRCTMEKDISLTFHHIRNPVSLQMIQHNRNTKYSPSFGMYSLDMENDFSIPIELHAFVPNSSLGVRIQTEIHIAFTTNDIE